MKAVERTDTDIDGVRYAIVSIVDANGTVIADMAGDGPERMERARIMADALNKAERPS